MNRQRILSVLGKIVATACIAAFFIALFINAPFLSQKKPVKTLGDPTASGRYALPTFNTGALPDGEPQFGLLEGNFAQTADSPGFSMAEKLVDGECEGAGRRYIASVCADCLPISGAATFGQPDMLTWTEITENGEALHSVAEDCVDTAEDGQVIVGVITFGEGATGIGETPSDLAQELVPLVQGGTRLAALEMGGWLTTMDEVSEPDRALEDMADALRNDGWLDAPGQDDLLQGVEGVSRQMVFSRENQATCIIYLDDAGGTTQLITIMSS